MCTIKMSGKNRLSLLDETGKEMAYNTIKWGTVEQIHIARLMDVARLLHLGEVAVQEGLPK